MISVVVPVYNVESYLHQCLQSLSDQTYSDFEVVIVNDGSTDNSLSICREFSQKDKRIRLIDSINQGVSRARKLGTESAAGEFVLYLDSDDWLADNAIEIVNTWITNENPDIISFGYYRFYNGKSLRAFMLGHDKVFQSKEELHNMNRRIVGLVGPELVNPHRFDAFASMKKAYRKSLLMNNNVQFLDTSFVTPGEDMIFNVMAYSFAMKVVHLEYPIYFYRRANFSSETGVFRNDFFDKWQNRLDYLESYLKTNNFPEIFFEAFQNRVCCEMIGLGQKITNPNNKASWYSKSKKLTWILSQPRYIKAFESFSYKRMPAHWKLYFIFCRIRFGFGVFILSKAIRVLKSKI